MNKLLSVILISFLLLNCRINKENPVLAQLSQRDSLAKYCPLFTFSNSRFWKLDSTGQNGFRYIFSDLILKECKLTGLEWGKIKPFFGKEYETVDYSNGSKELVIVRYISFHNPHDVFKYFNSICIDIIIKKADNKIVMIRKFYPEKG